MGTGRGVGRVESERCGGKGKNSWEGEDQGWGGLRGFRIVVGGGGGAIACGGRGGGGLWRKGVEGVKGMTLEM